MAVPRGMLPYREALCGCAAPNASVIRERADTATGPHAAGTRLGEPSRPVVPSSVGAPVVHARGTRVGPALPVRQAAANGFSQVAARRKRDR